MVISTSTPNGALTRRFGLEWTAREDGHGFEITGVSGPATYPASSTSGSGTGSAAWSPPGRPVVHGCLPWPAATVAHLVTQDLLLLVQEPEEIRHKRVMTASQASAWCGSIVMSILAGWMESTVHPPAKLPRISSGRMRRGPHSPAWRSLKQSMQ